MSNPTTAQLEHVAAMEAKSAAIPNVERWAHGWRYYPHPVEPVALEVGQRVKLGHDGKRWWTVRAVTDVTAVLTRQAEFKAKGELTYTVIDWRLGVRGPANTLGRGWDVENDESCQRLADQIKSGEWEISQRSWAPIDLEAK
jgi:uncharacterized membrane protein